MHDSTSRQGCHCRNQITNVLIVTSIFICFVFCCLFVMQLNEQAERAQLLKNNQKYEKDIAKLQKDITELKSNSLNTKETNKKLNKKKLTKRSLANVSAGDQDSSLKNNGKRSVKRCPFKKRKRICTFVRKEVSNRNNILKRWVNERLKNCHQNSKDAYARLSFVKKNKLHLVPETGNFPKYSLMWYYMSPDECQNLQHTDDKDKLHRCLTYRISPRSTLRLKSENGSREKRLIEILVAGNYLISCQLYMVLKPYFIEQIKSINAANITAQVSILMTRKVNSNKPKHVELLSQIPSGFNYTDGKEATMLYKVAMSGQAYLYANSKIRVTVVLKKSGEADENMGVVLHEDLSMNWFDLKLLKEQDDSRSREQGS